MVFVKDLRSSIFFITAKFSVKLHLSFKFYSRIMCQSPSPREKFEFLDLPALLALLSRSPLSSGGEEGCRSG